MKRLRLGFTLIELMIVVAIIGILAAIAYPSYLEHVQKSRRADAQAVLMEAAQFMERFFTINNRYDEDTGGVDVALPAGLQRSPKDGGTIRYNIAFNPGPAQSTFTLRATPVVADANCGSLTIDQAGQRDIVGPANLTAAECWRR